MCIWYIYIYIYIYISRTYTYKPIHTYTYILDVQPNDLDSKLRGIFMRYKPFVRVSSSVVGSAVWASDNILILVWLCCNIRPDAKGTQWEVNLQIISFSRKFVLARRSNENSFKNNCGDWIIKKIKLDSTNLKWNKYKRNQVSDRKNNLSMLGKEKNASWRKKNPHQKRRNSDFQ